MYFYAYSSVPDGKAIKLKLGMKVNILASARINMFISAYIIALQVTASMVENLEWNILLDFLFIYMVC